VSTIVTAEAVLCGVLRAAAAPSDIINPAFFPQVRRIKYYSTMVRELLRRLQAYINCTATTLLLLYHFQTDHRMRGKLKWHAGAVWYPVCLNADVCQRELSRVG
jgi:hypothetical protein